MSKKQYVIDQGEDFDPQSFYIEFGFKTRDFAEEELKRAVNAAYRETNDELVKSYLHGEFLHNDFQVLNESSHLDLYWINTVREVLAENTTKRKLDHAISHTIESQKKRSDKDRRILQTLTANGIIDLSNEGSSSQRSEVIEWEELKEVNVFHSQVPNLHEKTGLAIDSIMKKNITPHKSYLKSLSYQQHCPEEVLYIYKIITSVTNAFYTNASLFDLTIVPEPSELDINNQLWGPIIEALFSNSVMKIKSGETVLKDMEQHFKVDYRIGIVINHKFIDISNIEIGKQATTSKIKDDHSKLVLEAKSIITRIVGPFYFIKPSSFSVPSLQICRLKADFLTTTLKSPHQFVTGRVCNRMRAPLHHIDNKQMKSFLQGLMLYKEHVEETAIYIKNEVNSALDRRSSFGLILGQSYKKNIPNYHNWLEKANVEDENSTTATSTTIPS